jgi:hypothetical protein
MKRTIVFSLIVVLTTLFNYSFGRSDGEPLPADEPGQITTLIINADVTVVLVNNDKAILQVTGGRSLTELITFKNTGDTLVIGSTRNRDMTTKGTIYVPAHKLRNIRVNSKAHVLSYYALHIPKLDVVINGACRVSISNIGELNLVGTDSYYFDHSTEVRRIPAGILRK